MGGHVEVAMATDNPYYQEADRTMRTHQHERTTMLPFSMNDRWPCASLGLVLGCLLFVALPRCEAQNLVPNPSFEETDSCLEINTWYYAETGPLGWFSTSGSGDYYLSCLPYGAWNGAPLSAVAFQYPQE